ncbi:UPF0178 protein YqxD [Paenibacillus sp. J31TS4]|uniref:YaiI/YqxD family protein n=1 Tax=Paenibacillus sp. J31TS4 TaxID=2807195 RepID=UPI001B2C39BB|nr:DUF188 domain-containing protein [Paenibacillus sp. J31TS4]GIP39623.1 UPF0178 protein YqxD [Paenibacillus sp. J31TS4]
MDADACPVKQEIIQTARRFGIGVWMVASYAHRLVPEEGVEVFQVDPSDQSADLFLANRLQPGDVLVTQDFGLATIGLAKRAVVLSNRGQEYRDETIDFLLDTRHAQAKKRRAGKHTKGPKPFSDEDRARFLHSLTKVLGAMQEKTQ